MNTIKVTSLKKARIVPPTTIIGRMLHAYIGKPDEEVPEVEFELIEDHYYICRDGQSIVVLRATSDRVGTRPIFVPAPGEVTSAGSCQLLIIADLGVQAP